MNRKYYIVLDVETANSLEQPLVYDLGIAVVDKLGRIYEEHSLTIRDVFVDMKDTMQSAYYAEKLPSYRTEMQKGGLRRMVNFYEARTLIFDLCKRWNTKAFYAYNMDFDNRALRTTQRYLSKSKYRWFLPYGSTVNCIWHMACQVICKKTFVKWAENNGFISETGNVQTNAQVVYAYITADASFQEEHKGIDDVRIEAKILVHCFRQKKKMSHSVYRPCWRLPQKYRTKKVLEIA